MKSSKSVASKYTSTTNGTKKKKHASGKSKSISTLVIPEEQEEDIDCLLPARITNTGHPQKSQ
eukprot:13232930-Ditylum_brightwellii.AAC.1